MESLGRQRRGRGKQGEREGRERKEEGEKKSKELRVGAVQEGLPGVPSRLTAAYVYEEYMVGLVEEGTHLGELFQLEEGKMRRKEG